MEKLGTLMTKRHHMATIYFEHQVLFAGLEFARSRAISTESCVDLFRQGARAIRSIREGIERVQRRLEELQQQHLTNQQAQTDSRGRVPTIVSAIFLPLSLIAGIYGMNFDNMPELHASYAYFFFVLVLMVVLAVGMIWFFYWKGWFR